MPKNVRFWLEALGLCLLVGLMVLMTIIANDGNWCGWVCSDDVRRRW